MLTWFAANEEGFRTWLDWTGRNPPPARRPYWPPAMCSRPVRPRPEPGGAQAPGPPTDRGLGTADAPGELEQPAAAILGIERVRQAAGDILTRHPARGPEPKTNDDTPFEVVPSDTIADKARKIPIEHRPLSRAAGEAERT